MFKKETEEAINFSFYMGTEISEKSKDLLSWFSKQNPEVKRELIEQTKNAMANTIFDKNQTREYIEGVKDTLKYINRFFK